MKSQIEIAQFSIESNTKVLICTNLRCIVGKNMHFVTLDDDDDHEPFPTQTRLSSTSNNHMIHDQIRLGLVAQQHTNPRSYSIGSSYSNGPQKSTKCWIFLAGGVSTVAVFAVSVAIFLLTLNGNANGSNSGGLPKPVQLSAQPLGPTSIDVQWSCAMNQTIDAFQLEMIPRALANATNHWNASTTVNMLDNGLSCQTVVSQLNSSTSYCFRIRAQSKLHGDSSYTNVQCNSTTTASIPEIPNAPTAIDFSANTNTSFDRLHVVAAPKYNTKDHKQMAHTMQLYINAKHIKNVTIDKRTNVADAKLELDHAQRGHLILLTSSACNDQGCSPLSDSIRCVVALRGKHGKPTALCSSCEVGPGGGTESSTLAPPTRPTANSGPSTTSALVAWNWGEGGGGSGTCGNSKPSGFQVQRSDAWTKKTVLNGPLINISSSGSDVVRGGGGGGGGNSDVTRGWGRELSNNGAMFTIKIDGLLPAMAYNMRMRAYTIRTNGNLLYSRWSEVFVVKMKEAGECGNSGDVLVQRDHFTTMVPDIQSCMLKCIVSGKECVDECVVQKIGLSAKCAACWGQEGTCVEAHCAALCLKDSKGEPCLQCTNENCMPAMEQCTGLPRYTFPNP
jgi:hypothetical protein